MKFESTEEVVSNKVTLGATVYLYYNLESTILGISFVGALFGIKSLHVRR
jgi:hypothetical protein